MKNTASKVHSLMDELYNELRTVSHTFITEDDYDEGDDAVYDAPRVRTTDKNGMYHIEYVVLSIDNSVIHAAGLHEDYGDMVEFDVRELGYSEILEIVNSI